jgi:PAS domain S-box-containing protein
MRFRTCLLLVAAAAAVPLIGFGVLGVAAVRRDHAAAGHARLLQTARALAEAADRQLESFATLLQALTDAISGDGGPADLGRLASRVRPSPWRWIGLALFEPDGRLVFTTETGRTRAESPVALVRGVAAAGVPAARLVVDGQGPPRVLIGVPRYRNAVVRDVLTAALDPAVFRELLVAQALSAGWTGMLADGERRLVAGGRAPGALVAEVLPTDVSQEVGRTSESVRRLAPPTGDVAYVAWSRAPRSGWLAVVAAPAAAIEARWQRTLAWLSAGGLTLALAGGLAALLMARRVTRAVTRLGEAARALGDGGPVPACPPGGVREVRDVEEALRRASLLLRERERERDRAHADLREHNERLSLTLGLAGIGTWDLDFRTGVSFWDPEHFRLFGYAPPAGGAPVPLELWQSHLHPEDRDRVLRTFQRARTSGGVYEPEYRIVRAGDGREVWIGVKGRVLADGAGQPTRMLGVLSDITDRKRAELALREARQTLELTLDAGGLGAWRIDLATGVLECSAVCRSTLGLPDDGPLTWAMFLEAVHPEDRVRVRTLVDRAIGEQVLYEAEHRILRPDGRTRWLLARGRADCGPDGSARSLDGVLLDVTRHKEAELALEEANRAKDEFLAMLGHELRNPLGAISNAVTVLEQVGPGDVRGGQVRSIIARQTRHLARLIDDLLDVSRLTTGRIALQLQPVDLAEVAERALQALRHAARTGGHEVSLAVERVLVAGDPTRLEQVVLNLVDNAVKYTPPAGRIRVTVARDRRDAVLRVQDTGVGLPPDLLPRVFELFRRGHQARQHGREGLGIGLWLVKRLVEMHGGEVTAVSPGPGQGSEFVVRLPTVPLAAPPAAPGGRGTARRPQRVLVIEDHQDIRDGLRLFLEANGHSVDEAADGPTGLEKLLVRRPDVALVDVGLPGLDGYAIASAVRNAPGGSTVRLVAMTGYGQPDDRRRALESGFDAHLVKPVDLPRLLDLMDAEDLSTLERVRGG